MIIGVSTFGEGWSKLLLDDGILQFRRFIDAHALGKPFFIYKCVLVWQHMLLMMICLPDSAQKHNLSP